MLKSKHIDLKPQDLSLAVVISLEICCPNYSLGSIKGSRLRNWGFFQNTYLSDSRISGNFISKHVYAILFFTKCFPRG